MCICSGYFPYQNAWYCMMHGMYVLVRYCAANVVKIKYNEIEMMSSRINKRDKVADRISPIRVET